MKNLKTNVLKRRSLLATALICLLAFSLVFSACDNDPLEDEGSYKMEGSGSGAYYEYRFRNFSDHEVTVNIDGSKKTLTAKSTEVSMSAFTSPVTVKYSPSSKVRPVGTSMSTVFYNR